MNLGADGEAPVSPPVEDMTHGMTEDQAGQFLAAVARVNNAINQGRVEHPSDFHARRRARREAMAALGIPLYHAAPPTAD